MATFSKCDICKEEIKHIGRRSFSFSIGKKEFALELKDDMVLVEGNPFYRGYPDICRSCSEKLRVATLKALCETFGNIIDEQNK